MAAFTKKVTVKKRYDYEVPAPAHASEVLKAINVAESDISSYMTRLRTGEPEPEIFVTAGDEDIVVYWEHDATGPTLRELNPSERR